MELFRNIFSLFFFFFRVRYGGPIETISRRGDKMLERRPTKGSSLFEAAARSFHIGITRRYKGSLERWNGIGHEKADRSVDCSSEIGDSSHAVTFFIFDPFSQLFTRPTYRIEICWNRTTVFVAFANIDGNFVSVTNSTVFKIS